MYLVRIVQQGFPNDALKSSIKHHFENRLRDNRSKRTSRDGISAQ